MIVDTHAHCYWDNIEPRIEEVISNMKINNVDLAIQIGCDIQTSQKAIDLAKRFPGIFYATV
jgi:Tat protein secretion system quality control protein TatD with DNase activity